MPSSALLHDAMAARVSRGEFPGIVTLVARGDEVTVDAIGVTRFGGDVPMRRDTPFRITSMTKPIIAAVTMMLIEDGVLDLAEPVQRLLPELADRRVLTSYDAPLERTVPADRPITVADLLTFQLGSGLITDPDFDPPVPVVRRAEELGLALGKPEPRTAHDVDEWMRRFGTLPLIYQPGERWNYNTGSHLLGVLLARATGRPLCDVLRERLFDPLGMSGTGFWLPAARAGELPAQYQTDPETSLPSENTDTGPDVWTRPPSFPSGAGGLASTIDDLLGFARMLLDGGVHGGTRLLSEQSVEAMTTNHLTPEQIAAARPLLDGSGWGYGLAVTVAPDDISAVPGRYGWSGGYGTTWFNDPHERLIGIALTQVGDFLSSGALHEFQQLAYRAGPESRPVASVTR